MCYELVNFVILAKIWMRMKQRYTNWNENEIEMGSEIYQLFEYKK
jgi:hypothetical protein